MSLANSADYCAGCGPAPASLPRPSSAVKPCLACLATPGIHLPPAFSSPSSCRYPHALYFLDLLQSPEFRAAIANPSYKVRAKLRGAHAALMHPAAPLAAAAFRPVLTTLASPSVAHQAIIPAPAAGGSALAAVLLLAALPQQPVAGGAGGAATGCGGGGAGWRGRWGRRGRQCTFGTAGSCAQRGRMTSVYLARLIWMWNPTGHLGSCRGICLQFKLAASPCACIL